MKKSEFKNLSIIDPESKTFKENFNAIMLVVFRADIEEKNLSQYCVHRFKSTLENMAFIGNYNLPKETSNSFNKEDKYFYVENKVLHSTNELDLLLEMAFDESFKKTLELKNRTMLLCGLNRIKEIVESI